MLPRVPVPPLTSPISLPLLVEGGNSGFSTAQKNCGVFIGRWRPASKVDPHLRARVAVKVMTKDDVLNRDIPCLLTMNFPYVNHFRGEFGTSQQLLGFESGSDLTIMVSSFCAGGDHFSAIAQPVQGAGDPTDPYSIHLQFVEGSGFCFGNPDFDSEEVNHGMVDPFPFNKSGKCYQLFSFICVSLDPSSPSTGVICRVEKRGERFFQLFCSDPQCDFPYVGRRVASARRHMNEFTREFVLPQGAASAACCMLLAETDERGRIMRFQKYMPRPNAPFLRAFAVQLLRAVGYCHSRKLTSHNDLKWENVFHKSPLNAHLLLCSVPPGNKQKGLDDPHAILRALQVEVGDFGRATFLQPGEGGYTKDFAYAAMLLVGTLNRWAFDGLVCSFLETVGNYSLMRHIETVFFSPFLRKIRSNCAHFPINAAGVSEEADAFVDLLSTLIRGPVPPQKAVDFAEHLVETHSFFSPLRLHQAALAPPEFFSLADYFGGVGKSPHSEFQRWIAELQKSDLSDEKLHHVLKIITTDIMNSSAAVLSEKIRYGAVDVLVEVLRARGGDFEIRCRVLRVAFEIIIFCPNDRHILMHFTHQLEHDTTANFLSYLVNFACYAPPDLSGADVSKLSHMQASALECISHIVTCSIPYCSLSDFPIAANSCYSSSKMQSLLTGNVLRSILVALNPSFSGDDAQVIEAFADDGFFAEAHHHSLRDKIRRNEGGAVRWNETVEAWARLLGVLLSPAAARSD